MFVFYSIVWGICLKDREKLLRSAEEVVAVGVANAMISGYLNGKMEPYNVATFQTHLGGKAGGSTNKVCPSHGMKIGTLEGARSFVLGVTTIYGPDALQSNGLGPVQAENVTTAINVGLNTVLKHGILKYREKAALNGSEPSAFSRGMTTTVFTTALQQKTFLAAMRHAQEKNVDKDGKLDSVGLAVSTAQVAALGAVVSPIAQIATTYSRYPDELTKNLQNSWEQHGLKGVARVTFPKTALIAGGVGYGVSAVLSAVGRGKIRNPIDEKTLDDLKSGVGYAKKRLNEIINNNSPGKSR